MKVEDRLAGWLIQDDLGYHFVYDKAYLSLPVSEDGHDFHATCSKKSSDVSLLLCFPIPKQI